MNGADVQVIRTATLGFGAQDQELRDQYERQLLVVHALTATGSGDIDETFALEQRFRLIYLRCHFAGTSGTAPLHLSVDSAQGSAYDARLFTIAVAGIDKDVHLRVTPESGLAPSPWTLQAGDAIRLVWTNPDSGNITWGLEIGLSLAP
jgi:hypothetical protein